MSYNFVCTVVRRTAKSTYSQPIVKVTFGLCWAAPVPVWRQISRQSCLCARDFMLLKSPPSSLCKVTDHHQRASWCPLSRDNGNNEHKKSGKGAMALKGRSETNACCLNPVSALCLSKSVASCRLKQMGQFSGGRKHKTGHPSHHYYHNSHLLHQHCHFFNTQSLSLDVAADWPKIVILTFERTVLWWVYLQKQPVRIWEAQLCGQNWIVSGVWARRWHMAHSHTKS